jgi:hypothetical protein
MRNSNPRKQEDNRTMPKKSFLIDISEELREGAFWTITSKRLPGLFLGGQELKLLREDLPVAIKLLFKANYSIDVEVAVLVDGPNGQPVDDSPRFTAMPLAA